MATNLEYVRWSLFINIVYKYKFYTCFLAVAGDFNNDEKYDDFSFVKLLLEWNMVDPRVCNQDWMTALHIAVSISGSIVNWKCSSYIYC